MIIIYALIAAASAVRFTWRADSLYKSLYDYLGEQPRVQAWDSEEIEHLFEHCVQSSLKSHNVRMDIIP